MNQLTTAPKTRKTKGKRLTPDDYDQIKLLLAAGLKSSLVAEVSLRSHGTVARIKDSKDFDDYKADLAKANAVYHARAAERNGIAPVQKVEDPEASETFEPAPEARGMNLSEVQMERIANALERLADAWEAHPKRTGLFGK